MLQTSQEGSQQESNKQRVVAHLDCPVPIQWRLLCVPVCGEGALLPIAAGRTAVARDNTNGLLIKELNSLWKRLWIAYPHCRGMQGRSVRRFNGASLAYVRIAAELPVHLASPEGVCFSKNCMYVVRWVELSLQPSAQ